MLKNILANSFFLHKKEKHFSSETVSSQIDHVTYIFQVFVFTSIK